MVNSRTDVYKIMCSIDAHEKQQLSSFYDVISGGGNALTSNTITESLVSLSETFDFIDFWIKCFDHNYLEHSNKYI